MAETMTDRDIQYQFRQMSREISKLKRKAGVARDKQIIAEARSHDMKARAKSAEHGLRGLLQRCERNEQALARQAALLRLYRQGLKYDGNGHPTFDRVIAEEIVHAERELGDSHD